MAEAHLVTKLLSRRFGALAAVDRVSLQVERGQCHAIIGPNGAGKSTLLKLLSGELMPSSGQILLGGQDVTRAPPERIATLGVGRSYQTANLFGDLTCDECVSLSAQARLSTSMRFFRPIERYPEVAARAEKALARCGLSARRSQLASQLSYGEQRQLELGMILGGEPTLLLLDEPLAGLGHDGAAYAIKLLRDLSKDHTIVLVEHDMDAIFSLADVITVLVDGRILESGPPAQIKASTAVREAYLGEEQP